MVCGFVRPVESDGVVWCVTCGRTVAEHDPAVVAVYEARVAHRAAGLTSQQAAARSLTETSLDAWEAWMEDATTRFAADWRLSAGVTARIRAGVRRFNETLSDQSRGDEA